MKALLLTDYKKLELADMPQPGVGPDDVLVRVKACGICGSDIHGYDGSSGRRIPPLVMGHEAAGVVAECGSNITEFSVDDRVTFDSMVSCGDCEFCHNGKMNLCDNRQVLGVSCDEYRRHGAFAEYVVVPGRIMYSLPDSVSFEQAAMIEPISVAVHAANLAPISIGDTAVVVGAGMIGLLVVQALRIAGCDTIIAIDLDDGRLAKAKQLGADYSINAADSNSIERVMELTDGRGADVSVEAVGNTPAVQTAINCLRKGGAAVLVGNLSPQIELPLQAVVTREISLLGSCASSGEYPTCIELLAEGRVNVESLITSRSALEDAPAWFDRLYAHEPGLMKVIVQP